MHLQGRMQSLFGALTSNMLWILPRLQLFQALKATKVWIIGVQNLTIEVNAKYIKGMINNPDIQPNASMNQWIAAILLFNFKLQHVPGSKHARPDGLSWR